MTAGGVRNIESEPTNEPSPPMIVACDYRMKRPLTRLQACSPWKSRVSNSSHSSSWDATFHTATEELVSGCRREPKAGRWNRRGQGGDLDVCVRMHALNRARNNQQQQSPQVTRKYMDYNLPTTATNSPRSGPLATSCDRCRLAHAERRPRHKYSVNISWNSAGFCGI